MATPKNHICNFNANANVNAWLKKPTIITRICMFGIISKSSLLVCYQSIVPMHNSNHCFMFMPAKLQSHWLPSRKRFIKPTFNVWKPMDQCIFQLTPKIFYCMLQKTKLTQMNLHPPFNIISLALLSGNR